MVPPVHHLFVVLHVSKALLQILRDGHVDPRAVVHVAEVAHVELWAVRRAHREHPPALRDQVFEVVVGLHVVRVLVPPPDLDLAFDACRAQLVHQPPPLVGKVPALHVIVTAEVIPVTLDGECTGTKRYGNPSAGPGWRTIIIIMIIH